MRLVPGAIKKSSTATGRTPMARASGVATDGLLPGEFTHAASGVHYRLFLRDGRAWLSYDRPNAPPGRSLKGEQELSYFVGSGQRGRTYLFGRDGYWFESPVNWYGKQRVWDMNPKSIDAREMPFTLKVDPGCLHCHATGVQPTVGANNHFGAQPFLQGGVTLSVVSRRCCGSPGQRRESPDSEPGEIAAQQEGLGMSAMPPGRRDCSQCPGTITLRVHAGRRSVGICNSLCSLRRAGAGGQSDEPVGSAAAERVQEKERRPAYLHHLP